MDVRIKSEIYEIIKFSNEHREQVLVVWEESVLATHHFLKPDDFKKIKTLVELINFNDFEVYCLVSKTKVIGFIGISNHKIEMLFLSPKYFGLGLGKKLLAFAVENLNSYLVDVNEQNKSAVEFYKKFGFNTFERSEKDDQGNDYPILKMHLESFKKNNINHI